MVKVTEASYKKKIIVPGDSQYKNTHIEVGLMVVAEEGDDSTKLQGFAKAEVNAQLATEALAVAFPDPYPDTPRAIQAREKAEMAFLKTMGLNGDKE